MHISLLHVSIRTDHHQGVLLVLAKLLIKNYKIKSLKIFCMLGDAAAYVMRVEGAVLCRLLQGKDQKYSLMMIGTNRNM